MNLDNVPLLMALFWQGFSLSFVTVSWFQRLAPQFKNGVDAGRLPRVPLGIRFALSLLALCGALGAADLLSRLRGQISGTDAALVIGLAIGVWMAFILSNKESKESKGSNKS